MNCNNQFNLLSCCCSRLLMWKKNPKSLFRFQLFIIYETSEKQHLMKVPAPSGAELDKHCCHSTQDLTDFQCALWINSSKSSGIPGTAWFSQPVVFQSSSSWGDTDSCVAQGLCVSWAASASHVLKYTSTTPDCRVKQLPSLKVLTPPHTWRQQHFSPLQLGHN